MSENTTKEPISAKETMRQRRLQKLAELVDKGINPYPYTFDKNANASDLQEKYKDNGIVVRSVSANIHGMSVDNVTITNVG